ncbi:MAG TPA: DEAD/DEAH box helicase [Candidatus Saccharimonadales bacterium]|nr:DEAD/DEAH box helicase [Candidatus Saccharimonadales bacterium]
MPNNSFRAAKRPHNNNFKRGRRSGGNTRGPKKQSIHPSKFINRAVERGETEVYQPINKFSDFALNTKLQANLAAIKFTSPSAIQDQAIPLALEGHDVIGLANTGTGKTAAFLLPILEKLNADERRNSVLIMAPTRELAQQIDEEFRRFSTGLKLYSAVCVGGTNIERQIRQLKRQPHVIIGTPGRLKDLLNRRVLRLEHINTFVLDEADRMLDMGFIADIRFVAGLLPTDRQTLCFSATMTPSIRQLVNDFMRSPETVSVRTGETSDHVDQDVVEAYDKLHKLELLSEMLGKDEFEKVLVFGETKYGVQRLADNLNKADISAEAIHGNKSQSQRQRALKAFKSSKVKVLVATDVAARGLDIPNVSHVINFDQPNTYDDYVHRIGRTGRGGQVGKALTFVEPSHHRFGR